MLNLVSPGVSRWGKLNAYFWIMRPTNGVTAGVIIFFAMFLALDVDDIPFDTTSYLLIFISVFFANAHIMVHNDIVDLEIDMINSPHRPLPSKTLSMIEAKIWTVILLTITCITGLIVDFRLNFEFPITLLWFLSNVIIADIYNLIIKKSGIWGNMVVAYVIWSVFIYADIVVNNRLTIVVEAMGLYVFFWILGYEVIKDILDIEGDKAAGIKTIAIRYGPRNAAIAGSILLSVAAIWTIPIILFYDESLFLSFTLIVANFIIMYRSIKLIKNPNWEYVYRTKKLYKGLRLFAPIGLLLDQIRIFVF